MPGFILPALTSGERGGEADPVRVVVGRDYDFADTIGEFEHRNAICTERGPARQSEELHHTKRRFDALADDQAVIRSTVI